MKTILSFAVFVWGVGVAQAQSVLPFSLPWMNGPTPNAVYNTADHPGSIVIIEAYFDACPFCNKNESNINDLGKVFASNPHVQLLDIGVDQDAGSYQDWIQNHHPNHPVLEDGNESVIGQLGTSGFPSTYILNEAGKVVFQHSGVFGSDTRNEIVRTVQKMLSHSLEVSAKP